MVQAGFRGPDGGGFLPLSGSVPREIVDLEPWDCVRRDMLILLLRSLVVRSVPGDLAEVGVYRGWTAKLIHHYLPDRTLHLFDTFAGFDPKDVTAERKTTGLQVSAAQFADTSEPAVRTLIGGALDRVHGILSRHMSSGAP